MLWGESTRGTVQACTNHMRRCRGEEEYSKLIGGNKSKGMPGGIVAGSFRTHKPGHWGVPLFIAKYKTGEKAVKAITSEESMSFTN